MATRHDLRRRDRAITDLERMCMAYDLPKRLVTSGSALPPARRPEAHKGFRAADERRAAIAAGALERTALISHVRR